MKGVAPKVLSQQFGGLGEYRGGDAPLPGATGVSPVFLFFFPLPGRKGVGGMVEGLWAHMLYQW